MFYFTNQTTVTAIKRQTYTGDKSTFGSVGSCTGYLRPLDEVQASVNNVQYGKGFSLIIETDVDIREMDKITIDSVDYLVQGVVNHNRGGITAYKKCVIKLPEN